MFCTSLAEIGDLGHRFASHGARTPAFVYHDRVRLLTDEEDRVLPNQIRDSLERPARNHVFDHVDAAYLQMGKEISERRDLALGAVAPVVDDEIGMRQAPTFENATDFSALR